MAGLPQAPPPGDDAQRRTRRFIRWLLVAIVLVALLAIGLCVASFQTTTAASLGGA
jgi:hypothetical protein